jgi:hypothetical protein
MEQIPIHGGEPLDNVVSLPGGRLELDVELEIGSDDEPEPAIGAATPVEPAIGSLLGEGARIMGGFISATSAAITTAMRDVARPPEPAEVDALDDLPPKTGPSPIGLAAGAAVGLTMQVSEAAVRAATSFAETAGPFLSWMTNSSTVRRGANDVEARAEALNDRWTQERPASEEAAASFASRVLPEITSAILDKLDLTQIAIDHIDIDRFVDSIDLSAIIHRVDLAGIANEVIVEIDLPELIRESTGAVTSETVRAVRMRSADADLLMGRIIDRLLRRRPPDDQLGGPDDRGEASAP